MKLETILNELNKYFETDDINILSVLKDKLIKTIKLETCYKTTCKSRVNAIKKIASKDDYLPALTGYGVMDNYKVITDTYHAIAIIEDNIPLEFKENFPDLHHAFNFNPEYYHPTTIDFNDVMSHYKMYKNDLNNPYKIENVCVNVKYLKNIIDVLGESITVYVPNNNYRPLYFKNNNNELGLLCPIKTY